MATETTAAVIADTLNRYLPAEATYRQEIIEHTTPDRIATTIICPPNQRRTVALLIEELYDAKETSNGVWTWESPAVALSFFISHHHNQEA